jgi:act minimal PKS acyl carrier protein
MEFTVDDLKRILLVSAGAPESGDLDGEILDLRFDELGYDSVALLETGQRVEREFGIRLDDSQLIIDVATPRTLVEAVNQHLTAAKSVDV